MSRPLLIALAVSVLAHALLLARTVWQPPAGPAATPTALRARLAPRAAHPAAPAEPDAKAASHPAPVAPAARPVPPDAPVARPVLPAEPAVQPDPVTRRADWPGPVPAGPAGPPVTAPTPAAAAAAAAAGDEAASSSTRAPVPGEDHARRAADLLAYRHELARAAREFKRYPAAARARGLTGVVAIVVRAPASAEGALPRPVIAHSGGSWLLDDAALLLVEQAIDAVELPPSLRGRAFQFALPIEYSLGE